MNELCLSRAEIEQLTPFDGWLDADACRYYLRLPAQADLLSLPGLPEPNEQGRRSVLALEQWAQQTSAAQRSALYRHYDSTGRLLYVGISLSAIARLRQHQARSHWADAIARVSIEWHPTREAAREAERVAIRTERPMHNKQGRR